MISVFFCLERLPFLETIVFELLYFHKHNSVCVADLLNLYEFLVT